MDRQRFMHELDDIRTNHKSKNDSGTCIRLYNALAECLAAESKSVEAKLQVLTAALSFYTELRPTVDTIATEADNLGHYLFMECSRVVLGIEFHHLPNNDCFKMALKDTIEMAHKTLSHYNISNLFHVLGWLLINQWSHPTLVAMMRGEDVDRNSALAYVSSGEYPELLRLRIQMLMESGCEGYSLNLISWCIQSPVFESDIAMIATHLLLLHRLGRTDDFHNQCCLLRCCTARDLLRHLLSRGCVDDQSLLLLMSQTFLLVNWMKQMQACCIQDLIEFWLRVQREVEPDTNKFLENVRKVASLTRDVRRMSLLLDIMITVFGGEFTSFCSELSVSLFDQVLQQVCHHTSNDDISTCRHVDDVGVSDAVCLSQLCSSLSRLYEHHLQMHLSCLLTEFSLSPSEERYYNLDNCFHQLSSLPTMQPVAPVTVSHQLYVTLHNKLSHFRAAGLDGHLGWDAGVKAAMLCRLEQVGLRYDTVGNCFIRQQKVDGTSGTVDGSMVGLVAETQGHQVDQQGQQGPVGQQRAVGQQGPVGQQCAVGQQGPVGQQCAVGQQGPVGQQCAVGQQGLVGQQCAVGQQGPVGQQCAVGQQGLVGQVYSSINNSTVERCCLTLDDIQQVLSSPTTTTTTTTAATTASRTFCNISQQPVAVDERALKEITDYLQSESTSSRQLVESGGRFNTPTNINSTTQTLVPLSRPTTTDANRRGDGGTILVTESNLPYLQQFLPNLQSVMQSVQSLVRSTTTTTTTDNSPLTNRPLTAVVGTRLLTNQAVTVESLSKKRKRDSTDSDLSTMSTYTCQHCQRTFNKRLGLSVHIQRAHGQRQKLETDTKTTTTTSVDNRHTATTDNNLPCGAVTVTSLCCSVSTSVGVPDRSLCVPVGGPICSVGPVPASGVSQQTVKNCFVKIVRVDDSSDVKPLITSTNCSPTKSQPGTTEVPVTVVPVPATVVPATVVSVHTSVPLTAAVSLGLSSRIIGGSGNIGIVGSESGGGNCTGGNGCGGNNGNLRGGNGSSMMCDGCGGNNGNLRGGNGSSMMCDGCGEIVSRLESHVAVCVGRCSPTKHHTTTTTTTCDTRLVRTPPVGSSPVVVCPLASAAAIVTDNSFTPMSLHCRPSSRHGPSNILSSHIQHTALNVTPGVGAPTRSVLQCGTNDFGASPNSCVGSSTGPTVGLGVGSSTGPTVGPDVGSSTGPTVGPGVGSSTGPTVGPGVGSSTGPTVSPGVGSSTGPHGAAVFEMLQLAEHFLRQHVPIVTSVDQQQLIPSPPPYQQQQQKPKQQQLAISQPARDSDTVARPAVTTTTGVVGKEIVFEGTRMREFVEYQCESCLLTFISSSAANSHVTDHHLSASVSAYRVYACMSCALRYRDPRIMRHHVVYLCAGGASTLPDVEQPPQQLFPCSLCSKTFISPHYTQRHIHSRHLTCVTSSQCVLPAPSGASAVPTLEQLLAQKHRPTTTHQERQAAVVANHCHDLTNTTDTTAVAVVTNGNRLPCDSLSADTAVASKSRSSKAKGILYKNVFMQCEGTYQCSVCEAELTGRDAKRKHRQLPCGDPKTASYSRHYSYLCPYCCERFPSQKLCRQHQVDECLPLIGIGTADLAVGDNCCPLCPKTCFGFAALKGHVMQAHHLGKEETGKLLADHSTKSVDNECIMSPDMASPLSTLSTDKSTSQTDILCDIDTLQTSDELDSKEDANSLSFDVLGSDTIDETNRPKQRNRNKSQRGSEFFVMMFRNYPILAKGVSMCRSCGVELESNANTGTHVADCTGSCPADVRRSTLFRCTHCPASFWRAKDCRVHQLESCLPAHGIKVERLTEPCVACPLCEVRSYNRSGLMSHMKFRHALDTDGVRQLMERCGIRKSVPPTTTATGDSPSSSSYVAGVTNTRLSTAHFDDGSCSLDELTSSPFDNISSGNPNSNPNLNPGTSNTSADPSASESNVNTDDTWHTTSTAV